MAPIISPVEIDIIILHLETLTKAGPVHQRTLYAELKPLLESVKDFSAFSNLLTACINYGRITGYKYVRNGCIAREAYVDGEQEHLPAKSVGFIYIENEKIETKLSEKALKKLLVDVLGGVEGSDGDIEIAGTKYHCSEQALIKRFLRNWF